jgi:small subunit ribosomal protein S17
MAQMPENTAHTADAAGTADPAGAAVAPEAAETLDTTASRGRRQVKVGRVVSDKMDKTVVVAVENTVTHRLYHRYLKRTSKFAAHDEQNQCHVGDVVEIVSSRPLSRMKRWRVRRILKRAE